MAELTLQPPTPTPPPPPASPASAASAGTRSGGAWVWVELDILRGLAAIMMVLNHAANAWAPAGALEKGELRVAEFIGSFAPVLFFFVTGLGYGIRRSTSASAGGGASVCRKAIILLLIDWLLHLEGGHAVGLGFLGFTALSMLVLQRVRSAARPSTIALGLAALLLGLRYGPGSYLAHLPPSSWGRMAAQFLGGTALPAFPYPLAPWLVYPLLGLVVAPALVGADKARPLMRAVAVGLLGGLLALVAAALARRGMIVFRWGTVSAAFFVAGLGVCGLSFALSSVLSRSAAGLGYLRRAISVRGVGSLAIVPLHYAAIAAVTSLLAPMGSAVFFVMAVLTTALVIGLARLTESAAAAIPPGARRSAQVCCGILFCLTVAAVAVLWGRLPGWRLAIATVGELSLCLLLGMPTQNRPREAASLVAAQGQRH